MSRISARISSVGRGGGGTGFRKIFFAMASRPT
jgi:hypothetical protein